MSSNNNNNNNNEGSGQDRTRWRQCWYCEGWFPSSSYTESTSFISWTCGTRCAIDYHNEVRMAPEWEAQRELEREAIGSDGEPGPLPYPPRRVDNFPESAWRQPESTRQTQGSNVSPLFNAFRSGPGQIGVAPSTTVGQYETLAERSTQMPSGRRVASTIIDLPEPPQGPAPGAGRMAQQTGYTQTGAGQNTPETGYVNDPPQPGPSRPRLPRLHPPPGEECECKDCQEPSWLPADNESTHDTEPITDEDDRSASKNGGVSKRKRDATDNGNSEAAPAGEPDETQEPPMKRGRGRPKGSTSNGMSAACEECKKRKVKCVHRTAVGSRRNNNGGGNNCGGGYTGGDNNSGSGSNGGGNTGGTSIKGRLRNRASEEMDEGETPLQPSPPSKKRVGKSKATSTRTSASSKAASTRSSTAATTPYEFPEDSLEGSIKMSIHTTFSRHMDQHLVDLRANTENARSAWADIVETLQRNLDAMTVSQMQEAFEATERLQQTIGATQATVRNWSASWEQGR